MRQCRQIHAQGNILVRKFSMCSNAVKITLFRTYCSSLYTSQLWWNYSKTAIKKMYVAYNNAFRMLFRLPRDCSASGMFAQNGVLCCPAVIRNLIFRFRGRLNTSSKYVCTIRPELGYEVALQDYIDYTGGDYCLSTLRKMYSPPPYL